MADVWFLGDDGSTCEACDAHWSVDITRDQVYPADFGSAARPSSWGASVVLEGLPPEWSEVVGLRGWLTLTREGESAVAGRLRCGFHTWDDGELRGEAWGKIPIENTIWHAGPEPPPSTGIMAALRRAWK